MNILQINNYFYPKGGSEIHFLDLIELLESKGHKVIPFSTKNDKNIPNQYSEYWPALNGKKYFLNFKANQKLKLLLDKKKIDLAHFHNINHGLSPLILKTLKKRKIPIIMTTHDYSLVSANYNLNIKNEMSLKYIILSLEFYLKKIFFSYHKLVDIFIAPSKFMENKLRSHGFKNIATIHNFTESIENNPSIGNYFLYFGRLSSEKGLEKFIKSLSRLKRNFNFYIAGDGSEKDKLTKLVKKLNLNKQIKFLGYQNREKELPELIDNAQFIVIPSLCQENCSLSILESLARGKFVIAPDLGGNSELINRENGFLYEINDSQELLDKIDFLVDNRELLNGVNIENKKLIKSQFDKENYYQKLINIYKQI